MVHPPEEGHESADDGTVRTAEQAQDVARGFLRGAAPDGGSAVDAVLLVVSELFTNAVRHAGGVSEFGREAGRGTVGWRWGCRAQARHRCGPFPGMPAS